jgi:hypothetical protein
VWSITYPGCSHAGRLVRMRWCFGSGKYFSSSCGAVVVVNWRLERGCFRAAGCGVVLAGLAARLRWRDCWGVRPLVLYVGVRQTLDAATIDILGSIVPWVASMGARAAIMFVDMTCVCYVCSSGIKYSSVVIKSNS